MLQGLGGDDQLEGGADDELALARNCGSETRPDAAAAREAAA